MIFDFNSDYLPPPPSLPPFVHEQNAAMKRFAEAWNQHYRGQPSRQINPPLIRFVEAEGTLEDFTRKEPNVPTVKGDWPLSWAYYDEPGHRTGLLAGREAHNRILAAERLYAGLMQKSRRPWAYPVERLSKMPGKRTVGPTTAGVGTRGPRPTAFTSSRT